MKAISIAVLLAALSIASAVTAQTSVPTSVPTQGGNGMSAGATTLVFPDATTGLAHVVRPSDPLPAVDANNAAFQGAVTMTVGTSYSAARSVAASCTVAGTMTVVFANASSATVPLSVGWQAYPFAVTQVSSATATCTYYNLI